MFLSHLSLFALRWEMTEKSPLILKKTSLITKYHRIFQMERIIIPLHVSRKYFKYQICNMILKAYLCFNNFIDWFDYLIIWDEVPTMVEIAIFWFQIHITNGLNFMHRKWHTGNQYMVKSAENRMRSNLEGCRTFRNLVDSYQFRTFFSTHRFVINSLIKMLYV